jgi:37-kD nucleoid-associated bacterial protein
MDFRFFQINRMIMHKIAGKTTIEEAKAVHRNKLIKPTVDVVALLKVRLTDACGKQSNSFTSEIEDINKFFAVSQNMKNCNNSEFIDLSKGLADQLAACQTSRTMKTGTLIVLDGSNYQTNKHFAIVIKAEFDNVMNTVEEGEELQVQILEEVFLSKNQKLFKIGILYELDSMNTEANPPNDHFSTLISGPADYFYKDFLGFKIESNAKIRTQIFYEKTLEFIKKNIPDAEQRQETISKFIYFLRDNKEAVVINDFKNNILPEDLRDKYTSTIQEKFPHSFLKDIELIKTRLRNRKITFKNGVYIHAPEDVFENDVTFINTQEELDLLLIEEDSTIVKINGKAYSNE